MGEERNTNGSKPGRSFGTGAERWLVTEDHIDMATESLPPKLITMQTDPQAITFDLQRSVLIVIDMINDFCTKGGGADLNGFDIDPCRAPIEPLRKLLPIVRQTPMRVIWLNWGVRLDLLNMPPNQLHIFNPTGEGVGMGDSSPGGRGALLVKDSWGTAVVNELERHPEDIILEKYRISGFWDTPLDSILRNKGARTIFFAGVNMDQCVLSTLQDASFLGYGCILLADCCATTSPEYCIQATLYNVNFCYGIATDSRTLINALAPLERSGTAMDPKA
jgi:nicotinamidase-related amidase